MGQVVRNIFQRATKSIRRLLLGSMTVGLEDRLHTIEEDVRLLWKAFGEWATDNELPSDMRRRISIVKLQDAYIRAPKVSWKCPICEHDNFDRVVRVDRHSLGVETGICRHCGFVTLSPRPTEEWLSNFYKEYFWPVYIGADYSSSEDIYVRDNCQQRAEQIVSAVLEVLSFVPKNCLDIGAGFGATMSVLSQRLPTASIKGVELSREGVNFCRNRGLDVDTGDIHSLSKSAPNTPKYDLITMIHVLEHVSNPVHALTAARSRLAKDGCIYIEVPDLESKEWRGKDFFHIAHLHYFYKRSLINLFDRVGLSCIQTFHGPSSHWPWAIGVLATIKGTAILPAEVRKLSRLDRSSLIGRTRRQVDA